MVVAGGGGGGNSSSGPNGGSGGGAGGFREDQMVMVVQAPLHSFTFIKDPGLLLPVTATGYPITVGAGGAGAKW